MHSSFPCPGDRSPGVMGTYLGDCVTSHANLARLPVSFSAFPLWLARVVGIFTRVNLKKKWMLGKRMAFPIDQPKEQGEHCGSAHST